MEQFLDKVNTRSVAAIAGLLIAIAGLLLTALSFRSPAPAAGAPTTTANSPPTPSAHRFIAKFLGQEFYMTTGSVGVCFVFLGVLLLILVTSTEVGSQQKIRCGSVAWEGDKFIRSREFYGFIKDICGRPGVIAENKTLPLSGPNERIAPVAREVAAQPAISSASTDVPPESP